MTLTAYAPDPVRDVSPHASAIRLTGSQNGLPNGFQSGGAWLYDDEVWKPLDGCGEATAQQHYPTQELDVLEEMAHQPLFLRNWRVEMANGRQFLVRPRAIIVGKEGDVDEVHIRRMDPGRLSLERVLDVEAGVRNLNLHDWEVSDQIQLAFDPTAKPRFAPFIYDMSNAIKRTAQSGLYAADDTSHILRFMEWCGYENLAQMRRRGHEIYLQVFEEIHFGDRQGLPDDYRHVYANFMRPFYSISGWWPKDVEVEIVREEHPNWGTGTPHDWLVTREPLTDELMGKFELKWAYSPLR